MSIPYFNPIKRKQVVYVPDLLIIYETRDGSAKGVVIEIKPKKQTSFTEAVSQRDKAQVAINMMKWQAASNFCKKRGLQFMVVTEDELFTTLGNSGGRIMRRIPQKKKK